MNLWGRDKHVTRSSNEQQLQRPARRGSRGSHKPDAMPNQADSATHHQLRSILSTIHRTCPWLPLPLPPLPLLPLPLPPCCRSGGRRAHISSAYFLPTTAMHAASTSPCGQQWCGRSGKLETWGTLDTGHQASGPGPAAREAGVPGLCPLPHPTCAPGQETLLSPAAASKRAQFTGMHAVQALYTAEATTQAVMWCNLLSGSCSGFTWE